MAPSLLCSKYRTLLYFFFFFFFFFFFLLLWKTTEEKVGHRHCFLLQCFPELDALPADNNPRTCCKARNTSAVLKEKSKTKQHKRRKQSTYKKNAGKTVSSAVEPSRVRHSGIKWGKKHRRKLQRDDRKGCK